VERDGHFHGTKQEKSLDSENKNQDKKMALARTIAKF
jgi:hypothetical protein